MRQSTTTSGKVLENESHRDRDRDRGSRRAGSVSGENEDRGGEEEVRKSRSYLSENDSEVSAGGVAKG